jgi:tetratricopeptide (TPR) repeat protein
MSVAPPSHHLTLPSRLEVRRKLGEGAFGSVYEVYDREQQCRVALKCLERLDAHSLFRFKREFRELADILHPNLVRLHELFCFDSRWCFTMDLIQGVSFLDHVRPGFAYPNDAPTVDSGQPAESSHVIPSHPLGAVDATRLRSALLQLAEGVGALHRAGKLHRDLKPHNVLVCEDGRVVVLDFGLLADIGDAPPTEGAHEIVGTPAYMAPEAAAGLTDGAASDWYSLGVMLYEALTGRLPFEGKPISMLVRKQTSDPVDPEPLVERHLRSLARLSVLLLSRRPQDRPTLEAIRTVLQPASSGVAVRESDPSRGDEPAPLLARQPAEFLVGREVPLELMSAAFEDVVRGQGVMLRVFGRSGMGKSALVRFFVDDLRRSKRATVLVGRCFECESVPYKALDSLVDVLTQRLLSLSSDDVAGLLPKDLLPLTKLFPVLRRVPLIAAAGGDGGLEGSDPHEVRQSAFAALRTLLAEMSRRKPLVLWIDDLQWGDEDSASFLVNLLQPPDAPRLLLVLSHRSEDTETSPILRQLMASLPRATFACPEVEVGPLAPEACERLASLLFREEDGRESQPPPDVAGESGGSPLFLLQLVRHASRLGSTVPHAADVRLDDVLWEHVCGLSKPAQHLLRIVSLAGRSIELAVARRAAGLTEELRDALDVLRMQRLVRTQGFRGTNLVEPYHDRIREVVTAKLEPVERTALHLALAQSLEASGADPEALVVHYRGAGDRSSAWKYAIVAGDRAASALAFRRAAELYREALTLDPEHDAHATRIKLADALANAGHGAEASTTYLEALSTAPHEDVLEIRRKAAEQALRVGRVDEGLSLLQDMLAAAGMKLAKTPLRALLSLLLRRAWLRIRGFGYRGAYQIDREALRRIDIGWALAIGLSNSDAIRGADIQTRSLLLALATGEPSRIARGLALQAGMLAVSGPKNHARCATLLAASSALTTKLGDPFTLGWYHVGASAVAYYEGRFQDCIDEGEAALASFARCPGVSWERTTLRHYAIWCLIWLGNVGEASRRIRAQLEAAFEHGDLYSATDLRLFTSNMAWLADDDPEGARRVAEEAMAHWSKRGFHAQHYYALYAHGQIDLYLGDGVTALDRLAQAWSPLRASMLMQVQSVRLETLHLRARCALAAARQDPGKAGQYVRLAKADAKRLGRENSRFALPMAELTWAAIAMIEGRSPDAVGHLRRAIEGFDSAGMGQYAAAARRRLGDLEADVAISEEAVRTMEAEGIRNHERWARMLAPGFDPAPLALTAAST